MFYMLLYVLDKRDLGMNGIRPSPGMFDPRQSNRKWTAVLGATIHVSPAVVTWTVARKDEQLDWQPPLFNHDMRR